MASRRTVEAGGLVTLVLVGLVGLAACADPRPQTQASLSLIETLAGGDTAGYERAIEPRPFVFPADHGPHPRFRNEWWYVTGNLESPGGRRVGFQFTIFRAALAPAAPTSASAWATNQAYMAHLAVTDPEGVGFRAWDRFARAAAGLAGARSDPFRVWLESWSLEALGGEGGEDVFPLRLRAGEEEVGLDLMLQAGKPHVLQGEQGLSRKGPEPGNASFYYSHTRMPVAGTVRLADDTLEVSGLAWLDREWSTSALSDGQVGWDWFALQMDDGWDLMVYQLRVADGSAHPLSDGVIVSPTGERVELAWGDGITVEATGSWRSPVDGAAYPSGWRIGVPERGWDLVVTPVLEDQELNLAFRYWEGAVDVTGTTESGAARGRGYVELTGYAGMRPER